MAITSEKFDWYKALYTFDEKDNAKRAYKDLTDDDIVYLEAATRMDYDTCSALLDKYFRLKMPDTVVKHKVWRRDNKNDIWKYQVRRKKKSDAGWLGEGIYFYGEEEEAWKATGYGWFCNGFYINVTKPFDMDVDLHDAIVHANDIKVSQRMTNTIEKRDFDGVLWTGDGREEWCVLEPSQLKRASITRDDEGRVIPLSRRFDLSNPDNRY